MKKILCPTNFSPSSGTAIDYAIAIASRTDAELILFNAFELPDAGPDVIMVAQPGLGKESRQQLRELKDKILDDYDIKVSTLARSGEPEVVISKVAKEEEADLIVIATGGKDDFGDMIFGTVTMAVIRKSEIPVLAIPVDFGFDGEMDRILFATEKLEKDELGFKQLTAFAKPFDATIEVLHVTEDLKLTEEEEDSYEELLRKKFNYDNLNFHSHKSKDITKGIIEYFDKNPADMVALITRRRNFLERLFDPSLTDKLAGMAAVPMLVFHE